MGVLWRVCVQFFHRGKQILTSPNLNHTQTNTQSATLPASAWLILRVPVLYGASNDLQESSITALAADVLASPAKVKKVDDWAARFPTHTADVGEAIRRAVVKGLGGTQHFSSKERDAARGGRPFTKYSIVRMIGEILGKPTDNLTPDPEPPAGGAARPKDCE